MTPRLLDIRQDRLVILIARHRGGRNGVQEFLDPVCLRLQGPQHNLNAPQVVAFADSSHWDKDCPLRAALAHPDRQPGRPGARSAILC
jgi:hypothetical protein